MAVNPKKGLLNWPDYQNIDIDFFLSNVDNTIAENRSLVSNLRAAITTLQRRAEQARCRDERDRWEDAVRSTRAEIESLSDEAKRSDRNKRAATREAERRRNGLGRGVGMAF